MLFNSPCDNVLHLSATQDAMVTAEHWIDNTYSSENDANIAHKVIQQDIPFVILLLLYVHLDATLHHGVFSHEHNTVLTQTLHETGGPIEPVSPTTEVSVSVSLALKMYPSDVLELLGPHIVGSDNECPVVLVQE